ncbi:hypothetical protein GEMRC1_008905 [Eukaryota sp. GEM-RC1]
MFHAIALILTIVTVTTCFPSLPLSWSATVVVTDPYFGKNSFKYLLDLPHQRARSESSDVIQIFHYLDSDRSSYIIKPDHGTYHCDIEPSVNPIFPSVIPREARFLFETEIRGISVSLWRADYQNYSHSWFVHFNSFGDDDLLRFTLHRADNVVQVDIYGMKPVHFDYSDPLFDTHAYNCPGPKPPTNFTVNGSLMELNTSFPIGNITIKLDGETSTQTTTSSSDGRYSFKGVVPGTYTISVDPVYYQPLSTSIRVPNELVVDLKLKKRSGDWLIGFFNGPILPIKHSIVYMNLYNVCEVCHLQPMYRCEVDDTVGIWAIDREYAWQSITITNHDTRNSPVYVKQRGRQPMPLVGSQCYVKIYQDNVLVHTVYVPYEGSVKDSRWNIGYIDGFKFVVQNELVEE